MSKVKIIADSTCDLGAELIARYDIAIAPLYVTLGETSYRDGLDLTPADVFKHFEKNKETPKTAATSVGDFLEIFRPYAEAGRDIVFLSISGDMSAEIQNAKLAAQEFPGRIIRCVDSMNLSTGIGLLVIEAAERAEQGMDANQIASEIEALRPKVNASFVIDTLTFLHRGGRCSGLMAFGAAMLNIKPQISVMDGKMAPTEKFRGNIRRVALKYVEKQLADIEKIKPDRVFLTCSNWTEETASEVLAYIRSRNYFNEILFTNAGCVISSHCGPWTLGILYIEK